MKALVQISILSFIFGLLAGCSTETENSAYSVQTLPILNGIRVTRDDHLAIVGLVQELNRDDYAEFCTGTLIDPNYVLTAAHCVADCEDGSDPVENVRSRMRIGVGQSVLTYRKVVEIAEYHIHPDYLCKDNVLENDIAILKLSEPVLPEVALQAYPVGKKLDFTAEDIDSEDGIVLNLFGYGRTVADDPLSLGSKYTIQSRIMARCPFEGTQSSRCGEEKTKQKGLIYFDASEGGTCLGDSGGPAIWTKNGTDWVVGVTSYGYEDCKFVNADVLVSDYEDFISQFVPVPQAWPEEICDNQSDDDGDGQIDCDDEDCREHEACTSPAEETDPPDTPPVDNPEETDNPDNPDNPDDNPEQKSDSDEKGQESYEEPGHENHRASSSGCSVQYPGNISIWGWLICVLFAGMICRKREI